MKFELKNIIEIGRGELIHSFSESDFDQYVITGPQAFQTNPEHYLGRLVQVRLEAGAFGSTLVLLRHADNSLTSHANQFFFRVNPAFHTQLEKLFKDTFPDDPDRDSYSIQGHDPRHGFIVPSAVKEGETTPMREVKSAIRNRLSKVIQENPEQP